MRRKAADTSRLFFDLPVAKTKNMLGAISLSLRAAALSIYVHLSFSNYDANVFRRALSSRFRRTLRYE